MGQVSSVAIRFARGLYEAPGRIDLERWTAQVLAQVPIGTCEDCTAAAYGERITRGRHLVWIAATCSGCGDQCALPIRDIAPTAA